MGWFDLGRDCGWCGKAVGIELILTIHESIRLYCSHWIYQTQRLPIFIDFSSSIWKWNCLLMIYAFIFVLFETSKYALFWITKTSHCRPCSDQFTTFFLCIAKFRINGLGQLFFAPRQNRTFIYPARNRALYNLQYLFAWYHTKVWHASSLLYALV